MSEESEKTSAFIKSVKVANYFYVYDRGTLGEMYVNFVDNFGWIHSTFFLHDFNVLTLFVNNQTEGEHVYLTNEVRQQILDYFKI